MQEKIKVLVTGIGGGGFGHELVKSLRLANRYHIIGVDMNENSLGLCDVDESYLIPPASAPEYVDLILDICKRNHVKVLLSGSEPELKIISQKRSIFLDNGILILANSDQVIKMGLDKWETMNSLKGNGFYVPHSLLLKSENDIPFDFPLPAIIKPVVGGGGSNNTFLAQDTEEFQFACQYLIKQGKSVLIQEYVGTPDHEYTVGVLNNLGGVFIGSIAMRRNILSALSNRIKVPNRIKGREDLSPVLAISSGISQGVIGNFPEVHESCEKIAVSLKSQGPLNIQGRLVNGKWFTFEINPRFSGTSYMRALMGFNEPDVLIRHHILGEKISTPLSYEFGEVVRGLREQVIDSTIQRKPWLLSR